MRGLGASARRMVRMAGAVCALASSVAAAPPASKHVQPELVADVESIAAGRPFQAGPIEWPYPEIFKQGPVTSYGYTRAVLLPVTITPTTTLAAGTSVTLAARADWLE